MPLREANHVARVTADTGLHMSANALIPLLMSLHLARSEPPTTTGTVCVGAASGRTQRDNAVSWHARVKLYQASRLCRLLQTAAPR